MAAARAYVPALLRRAFAPPRRRRLEAAWFLATPPFALAALSLLAGARRSPRSPAPGRSPPCSPPGSALALALVTGLIQARAGLRTWLALLAAPWYVGWKAVVQLRALASVLRRDDYYGPHGAGLSAMATSDICDAGAAVVLGFLSLAIPLALLILGSRPSERRAHRLSRATAAASGRDVRRAQASSVVDLAMHFSAATSGQTVCLTPGDYGTFLGGQKEGPRVRPRAARRQGEVALDLDSTPATFGSRT